MRITFKSEDARAMDAFVREVVVAVKETGGSVFGPFPLPTRLTSSTPKSNTYLGSLAKSAVHLRVLEVSGVTSKVKAALESLKAPGVVGISITD